MNTRTRTVRFVYEGNTYEVDEQTNDSRVISLPDGRVLEYDSMYENGVPVIKGTLSHAEAGNPQTRVAKLII